jgi:hypothetical protein
MTLRTHSACRTTCWKPLCVEYIEESPGPQIPFTWHGGERPGRPGLLRKAVALQKRFLRLAGPAGTTCKPTGSCSMTNGALFWQKNISMSA